MLPPMRPMPSIAMSIESLQRPAARAAALRARRRRHACRVPRLSAAGALAAGAGHAHGIEQLLQPVGAQELLLERELADRLAGRERLLGDLGGVLVPDLRSQARDHHQGLVDERLAALLVDLETVEQV